VRENIGFKFMRTAFCSFALMSRKKFGTGDRTQKIKAEGRWLKSLFHCRKEKNALDSNIISLRVGGIGIRQFFFFNAISIMPKMHLPIPSVRFQYTWFNLEKIYWILIFLVCSSTLFAQANADSLTIQKPKQKSINGALFRSALIPGWGQWYNGKKLKTLLVLGGEAALIANAVSQNQKAQESRSDAERLYYEDNRGKWVWYAFAVYLLNILDAVVDAHLSDFDTSPDLSFQPNRGVQLCWTLHFNSKKGKYP